MKKKVLFVGGGTGGHIIPMLEVMAELQALRPDVECHYVGSAKDMVFPTIAGSSLRFKRHVIRTGKLNRHLTWKHVPEGLGLLSGLWQAYFLMRGLRPDLVFAKGGAASVPVAWAASRFNIPLYTHETDVAAGLANRFAGRYARTVFTAFPTDWYADLPAERLMHVGQPVRNVFREADTSPLIIEGQEIPADLPLIMVTGGSQGGRGLNMLVKSAWNQLLETARIVQVCGPLDAEFLSSERLRLPEKLRERLTVVPFLSEEFPRLMKRSTLVLMRSGGTIFELAAAKKPAVLVPLATAAQDHQRKNAAALIKAGAAMAVEQNSVTGEQFAAIVQGLLADKSHLESLAHNLAAFDRPEAARSMAQIVSSAL